MRLLKLPFLKSNGNGNGSMGTVRRPGGRRVLCLTWPDSCHLQNFKPRVIQLSRIHFRHSWCHRIRKSCLFPGKRIKYFFGRQVGRQVLNNCVRAHKEAEERRVAAMEDQRASLKCPTHPPASPPVSIGILSKWNQHNLSCSLIFHIE